MNICIISIYFGFEVCMYLYMLNEIQTPTDSLWDFKTSHVTLTNPGSYNIRYCGYCMIETSVSHSFDMNSYFNVSRENCDNYCEILTL
jgi:hypothetical protein